MQHRFRPIFCSAFLFIAAGNPGVAANDNDPPAVRADTLSASTAVSCSLRASPEESFDPPSTSSLLPQDRFVARLHFKEDISATADVRISWLGARFSQRYVVKIENEAADVTLRSYTLTRPSNDDEIIAELNDRHETRLADVWCLLRRHARGQGGGLRSSEAPNLFLFAMLPANSVWSMSSGAVRVGRSARARWEVHAIGPVDRMLSDVDMPALGTGAGSR